MRRTLEASLTPMKKQTVNRCFEKLRVEGVAVRKAELYKKTEFLNLPDYKIFKWFS